MKILIAETVDWEASVRIGSHHYAKEMLKAGHQVLWMSQYLHPLSLLTGKSDRALKIIKLWRGRSVGSEPGLSLYTPISLLPCRRKKLLDHKSVGMSSLKFTMPPLRSVLKRIGFGKVDIIWISNPLLAGLIDIVPHDALAFRFNDLYSGFSGVPKCVSDLEKTLVERADAVYATADVLMDQVRKFGKEPMYLSNGVEFDHFHTSASMPQEYRDIPGPRAIYVGAIESWFDTELLVEAARRLPEVSFVIIGSCRQELSTALSGQANIHLLGYRPYADLPGYLQHSDVALIPFRINELTKAVNPNKIYEYFAAGLPVVSTPLPEVIKFRHLAAVADGADAFTASISEAIDNGKDEESRKTRIQHAESNSWKARFDEAMERLAQISEEKRNQR